MNYYKRHIGDYMKDASHLSLLEHGVYMRLLDVYYTREVPIPVDQAARLISARSKDEREALSVVADEFFTVVDGCYTQTRCDAEIAAMLQKAETNRAVGMRGGRPKKETQTVNSGNPEITQTVSENNPDVTLATSHKPITNNQNNPPTPDGGDVPPGFAEFWKTWPPNDRKQAKGKCLAAWKKAGAERDAAAVLAHVERLKDSESWKKQGGQFVPAPLVYLGQRRWEGADDDAAEGVGAGVGVHFV